MVNKILYTCVMLLAIPFVYSALAVLFLVTLFADAIKAVVEIWE